MMNWYQILSYLVTNTIQIFLCLYLIAELLKFHKTNRDMTILSLFGSVLFTILYSLSLSQLWIINIEIMILIMMAYYLFRKEMRICIFLIFFYKVGVALWEFIISTSLDILFHSQRFRRDTATEYFVVVWVVQLLLLGIVVVVIKSRNEKNNNVFRLVSMVAILGMFGVLVLSEQTIIPLSDGQLTTWLILSIVNMMAVLFFHLNRQYEMEKEIARLKAEQADLLKRDYQTLNQNYALHAKLFHDIHNHLGVMYHYLEQENIAEAIQYLEDLQAPIKEMTQNFWTGNKGVDYLINSRIALAEQLQIHTKINIEFPHNTNIRNVYLTVILGNLLDNALEAAKNTSNTSRFLHLTIRRINSMLIIKVENSCETAPIIYDGKLQSCKSDTVLHGWGLKSVRTAVEQYDGTIETTYRHHTFRAVVTLSYNPIQAE